MINNMSKIVYAKPMAETRVYNIPEQLWRHFRAKCLLKGVKVNDQMIELIQKFVDEEQEKG